MRMPEKPCYTIPCHDANCKTHSGWKGKTPEPCHSKLRWSTVGDPMIRLWHAAELLCETRRHSGFRPCEFCRMQCGIDKVEEVPEPLSEPLAAIAESVREMN